MKQQTTITVLVVIIALAATAAALTGIFSSGGPGPRTHETFRGTEVTLYGHGIYRHMSADVAIQGIGQDVVTVGIAAPLLLLSLFRARSGARGGENHRETGRRVVRARFLLAGVLLYLLVTYTFYLAMATYNALFLVYALLMGCSFFALALVLLDLGAEMGANGAAVAPHAAPHGVSSANTGHGAPAAPRSPGSRRLWGTVLIINAALIGMLWLSVVVPPLLDGSVYPAAVQHYTTLIVQGFDLGLLLPASVVIGVLLRRGTPMGLLFGPVYLVFLSLIMTALIAKLIAMELNGVPTAPAIFIIPVIAVVAITGAVRMLPRRP
jgi:hypothetical protein